MNTSNPKKILVTGFFAMALSSGLATAGHGKSAELDGYLPYSMEQTYVSEADRRKAFSSLNKQFKRYVSHDGACKIVAEAKHKTILSDAAITLQCVGDQEFDEQVATAVRKAKINLPAFRTIVWTPGFKGVLDWHENYGRVTRLFIEKEIVSESDFCFSDESTSMTEGPTEAASAEPDDVELARDTPKIPTRTKRAFGPEKVKITAPVRADVVNPNAKEEWVRVGDSSFKMRVAEKSEMTEFEQGTSTAAQQKSTPEKPQHVAAAKSAPAKSKFDFSKKLTTFEKDGVFVYDGQIPQTGFVIELGRYKSRDDFNHAEAFKASVITALVYENDAGEYVYTSGVYMKKDLAEEALNKIKSKSALFASAQVKNYPDLLGE